MKRGKENVGQFVDEHLRLFNSPPSQQIADAKERAHRRLASESTNAVEQELTEFVVPRPPRRWRLGLIAAAAAIAVLVVMQLPRSGAFATVQSADGGLLRVAGGAALRAGDTIKPGETVRTNGGTGTVLKLADGSGIEMRSRSELWLEQAVDGVRIHLSNGTVIVNAAKQRTGHLYVETKDLTVSVVGTVFLVNAEEEGSRVAVIEGEVHVEQGDIKKNLRPGEQVSTNPSLEKQLVAEEIAWSSKAPEHTAMLQQNQAQQTAAPPVTPSTLPGERQPVTMVVVIDRSGSASGPVVDAAKEGAKAVLSMLNEKDYFGVMVFDYTFHWVVRIAEVKKEPMREAIDRIVAGGNTNMFVALREAHEQLKTIPGIAKHVLLLSDGVTPADDFQTLVSEMRKDKITVSTVIVSVASNRSLMADIAMWGGGRAYYVNGPTRVPAIFQRETELAIAARKVASDFPEQEEKYDPAQRVTLKGTLAALEWKNPNLFLTLAVENPDGSKTLWTGEGPAPHIAVSQGWTRASLEGMRTRAETLSVYGILAKDGSKRLMAIDVNGRSLIPVVEPSPTR
jgi:Mg-chelatase subunit ChlD